MSSIPSTTLPSSNSSTGDARDLRDVDVNHFLQLMITEMQNQDPLDPMDNSEILQQISQIREISATDKLSDSLDAMLLGQNLSTAGSLIGKEVDALTDAGTNVKGVVDRVSFERTNPDDPEDDSKELRLHIGEDKIKITNIRQIVGVNSSGPLDVT
jgi:flagellar basal-body rod modification protein FlgD